MSYSEDLEWLLRARCRGWRIEGLAEVLTGYRTSPAGLSADLSRMDAGWNRLVEQARQYAPELVARHFRRARAVHQRYLARRSLRLHEDAAAQGVHFMRQALRSDPSLLWRQPLRTWLTLFAVLVRRWRVQLEDGMAGAPEDVMTKPLVSVIIPVYQSAATVAESLQSVIDQTYAELEILLVDDGSTDQSMAICEQFDDARIRRIHQQNRGLAGARNTGIRHSRGAFLGFLDSDDLWLPTKVERHVAHLQSRPEVGVSFSRSGFIDEQSRPLGIYQMPKLQGITPAVVFCRNPIGNGSAVVIRREVFEAIRFQARSLWPAGRLLF